MHRINKIDYFVGAFLTTILNSSKGVPAIFDDTESNKRVEFSTDTGDFNVYIKYSTKVRKARTSINGKRKSKFSWNIAFTESEYKVLRDSFKKEDRENLLCLVCTNEKFYPTYMAVLSYEDALKCLENSTGSGSRKIVVTRIGREHDFYCYGVGFNKEDYIKCPVDGAKFLVV